MARLLVGDDDEGSEEEKEENRNYDKNDYNSSEHLLSASYVQGPVLTALHHYLIYLWSLSLCFAIEDVGHS